MSAACRSCRAPVEWAITPNGKRIPLDLVPVEHGNMIVTGYDPTGAARVVMRPGAGNRVSHFVTCPNSDEWRRR